MPRTSRLRGFGCLERRINRGDASRADGIPIAAAAANVAATNRSALVVGQVPGRGHGRAIRQIADVVRVTLEGRRQGRTCGMPVGPNGLRMVDVVARSIHGCAVREVTYVVDEDSPGELRAGG